MVQYKFSKTFEKNILLKFLTFYWKYNMNLQVELLKIAFNVNRLLSVVSWRQVWYEEVLEMHKGTFPKVVWTNREGFSIVFLQTNEINIMKMNWFALICGTLASSKIQKLTPLRVQFITAYKPTYIFNVTSNLSKRFKKVGDISLKYGYHFVKFCEHFIKFDKHQGWSLRSIW